jgi:hypothetical protein
MDYHALPVKSASTEEIGSEVKTMVTFSAKKIVVWFALSVASGVIHYVVAVTLAILL